MVATAERAYVSGLGAEYVTLRTLLIAVATRPGITVLCVCVCVCACGMRGP